jgi:flagellar basal-body rod protein FlgB
MLQDIFDKTVIPLLSRSLDVASLRQRSIASNVANVTTPGFRRSEVRFEEKLQQFVSQWRIKGAVTNGQHRSLGQRALETVMPDVVQPDDPDKPSGINNVDIDHEMAELAKNQLNYQLGIRLITKGFSALRTSIHGRPSGR